MYKNPLEHMDMLRSLLTDINSVLANHSLPNISISDITVTNRAVSDIFKPDEHLSSIIVNKIWPSINSAIVFHYTSKTAAESILNTRTLRLR